MSEEVGKGAKGGGVEMVERVVVLVIRSIAYHVVGNVLVG